MNSRMSHIQRCGLTSLPGADRQLPRPRAQCAGNDKADPIHPNRHGVSRDDHVGARDDSQEMDKGNHREDGAGHS